MEWYDYQPERVLLEKQAMAQKFPQFQLTLQNGKLCWIGTLVSNRNKRYQILVSYPKEFPDKSPEVYPIDPVIEAIDAKGQYIHQYPLDGKLCLFYPGDKTYETHSTAALVVAMTAAWFFAYETWLESGKKNWPGRSVSHM